MKCKLNWKSVDTFLYRCANLIRYTSMRLENKIKYFNLKVVKETTAKKEIAFTKILKNIDVHYFLKIDIEGDEYQILELELNLLKKCTGMCVEFHHVGTNKKRFLFTIDKLKKEFDITNVHINNYGGIQKGIPDVMEITFLRKNSGNFQEITYAEFIPNSDLNCRNNPNSPEIYYRYN